MISPTESQTTMAANLLHHLHPQACSGSHAFKVGKANGILVAVVSMLMELIDCEHEAALRLAARLSPRVVIAGCCPDDWQKGFGMPGIGETNASWDENTVVRTGQAVD